MSADPAMSDGLNWYRYANNNPIMYSDPSGMSSVGNTSVDPGFSVEFKPFEIRIKIGKSGGSSSGGDSATAPADNGDNNSSADNNEGTGDSNTGGNQSGEENSQNQDDGNSSASNNGPLTPEGDHKHFGKGGDTRVRTQDEHGAGSLNDAMQNSKYAVIREYENKKTGWILPNSSQMFRTGCLFMTIFAMAQIASGDDYVAAEEIVRMFDLAVDEGLVEGSDVTVNDRLGLLKKILNEMGYEDAEVSGDFYDDVSDVEQKEGWLYFDIYGKSGAHFELYDMNGNQLYRPSGLGLPSTKQHYVVRIKLGERRERPTP